MRPRKLRLIRKNAMRLRVSSLLILSQPSFLQFTVLDEDALCELVSFLEDLLIIDVGHG